MFVMRLPNLSSILASKLTPEDLSNFFIDVVKNVVTYREKKKVTLAIADGLKYEDPTGDKSVTLEGSYLCFAAGFQPIASCMNLGLSKTPNLQQKLGNEIAEEEESDTTSSKRWST
jgi:hypothetical protein